MKSCRLASCGERIVLLTQWAGSTLLSRYVSMYRPVRAHASMSCMYVLRSRGLWARTRHVQSRGRRHSKNEHACRTVARVGSSLGPLVRLRRISPDPKEEAVSKAANLPPDGMDDLTSPCSHADTPARMEEPALSAGAVCGVQCTCAFCGCGERRQRRGSGVVVRWDCRNTRDVNPDVEHAGRSAISTKLGAVKRYGWGP